LWYTKQRQGEEMKTPKHPELVSVNQTRLAQLVGVSRVTVHRWRSGEVKPRRRHRELVEEILGELAWLAWPENRQN